MSVLSAICLASLRKAEQDDQKGPHFGEGEWMRDECGSEEPDRGNNDSCQS